jgi:glycosyltransferase involved in cell wall biosynthesis
MQVLNFISGRSLGGTKQAFLDYTRMLSELGYDVRPMIRRGAQLKQKAIRLGQNNLIEATYLRSTHPLWVALARFGLRRATKALNPQIIICHKPIDLTLLRPIFPKAILIGVHHGFSYKHLEHADHLITVSKIVANYVRSQGIKTPITVLPNTVNIEWPFTVVPSHTPVTLGTMAVFRRKKKLDDLLYAFARLKAQNIQFKGIIAGDGRQKLYLRYLIKKLKLSDVVTLAPWVTDKKDFFDKIDVFCVSSRTETFNICILEAMAHSTCVLSTDCGGPSEIIADQQDGCLTPVHDIETMAAHLETLIKSPETRRRYAEAGYQKVTQIYASTEVAKKLDILLKSMLTAHRHKP